VRGSLPLTNLGKVSLMIEVGLGLGGVRMGQGEVGSMPSSKMLLGSIPQFHEIIELAYEGFH
jgi:hypothetical protein